MENSIWLLRKIHRFEMAGPILASLVFHVLLFLVLTSAGSYYPEAGDVLKFDIFMVSPLASRAAETVTTTPERPREQGAAGDNRVETSSEAGSIEPPAVPASGETAALLQQITRRADEGPVVDLVTDRVAHAKEPVPPETPEPKKRAIAHPEAKFEREKAAESPPDVPATATQTPQVAEPEAPPPQPYQKVAATMAEEPPPAETSAIQEQLANEAAERQAEAAKRREQEQQAADAAREKAGEQRQAAGKAAQDAFQEGVAREKAADEAWAAAQAQQEKLAREREHAAAQKKELERQVAEAMRRKAERERLAQLKSEQQRLALERSRQDALARERELRNAAKAERELQAKAKAERERERQIAARAREREREELQAAAKVERERELQAKAKAERERMAAEAVRSSAQQRLDQEKAGLARLAAERATRDNGDRAPAELKAAEVMPKGTTVPKPAEKRPANKGIVVPSIHGDLKLVIAEGNDLKLTVLFREYPKSRRSKPQTRSEAKRVQKITPVVVTTKDKNHEAVIEKTQEGIYIFSAEPEQGKGSKATFTLKIFESSTKERIAALGTRNVTGKTVLVKILMPEAILWDDEFAFTGSLEDSESVTKFNATSGLYWKEFLD
jgi:hypothetical protein